MTDKILIPEKALRHRLECPLRLTPSSSLLESPVLTCAENTARWLIAEQVGWRAPSAAATREVFDAEWKRTQYFQARAEIPPKEYATCVREGVRACRRIRDIIFRCEILQPVSPYALAIGDAAVAGEYAVLRSSRRKNHAFALYLRHKGVRIRRLVPDVVSFARWLDLGNRWTAPKNHHWKVNSVGVMHYWVSSDLSAEHKLDREFAREVLRGAVNVYTGPAFPVPGDHCKLCPTRACRPDDLVRPNPGFALNLLRHQAAVTVRLAARKEGGDA
jgi:hypothetical protein